MTQPVQPESTEVLKPTVWTQGLKEGMAVKIHHKLRKEAPSLKLGLRMMLLQRPPTSSERPNWRLGV
jgi:hypothetical protein